MDKDTMEYLKYKEKMTRRSAERKQKAMILELERREIDTKIHALETEQLQDDINFMEYQKKLADKQKKD